MRYDCCGRTRPMTRRLLNLLTALSLLLCVAAVALWVRSYFVEDGVQVTFRSDMVSAYSSAGTIASAWDRGMPPMPRTIHRVTDDWPGPVGGGYGRALVTFDLGAGAVPWGGSTIVLIPHWCLVAF